MASQTAERVVPMPVQDLMRRMRAAEPVTILDARSPQAWDSSNDKVLGALRVDAEHFQASPDWSKDRLTVVY